MDIYIIKYQKKNFEIVVFICKLALVHALIKFSFVHLLFYLLRFTKIVLRGKEREEEVR